MKKYLIIRRDNIGDLLCTTPLFRALRIAHPNAQIDVLVNSYNAPVVINNPDIDHVFIYTKAKHRADDVSLWSVYWSKFKLLLTLKKERYDAIILAQSGYAARAMDLAHWLAPKRLIGFEGQKEDSRLTDPILPVTTPCHHVESLWPLANAIGITSPPPRKLVLLPPEQEKREALANLISKGWTKDNPLIGIHISARKPKQRWEASAFVELIQAVSEKTPNTFFGLFWSPGQENDPQHPGDDEKAAWIIKHTQDLPVIPLPTHHLNELTGAMSWITLLICSDGGAMHIGAALNKPIICFFGNSDANHWHPWGVPHCVLHPSSQQVTDISVGEVLAAYEKITDEIKEGTQSRCEF